MKQAAIVPLQTKLVSLNFNCDVCSILLCKPSHMNAESITIALLMFTIAQHIVLCVSNSYYYYCFAEYYYFTRC